MNVLKPASLGKPSTESLTFINSVNRAGYILRLVALLFQLKFLRKRRSINSFSIDSLILCIIAESLSFGIYGIQYKLLRIPNDEYKNRYPLLFTAGQNYPNVSTLSLVINFFIVVTLLLTLKQYLRMIKTENIFQGASKTMALYITIVFSTTFIVKAISVTKTNIKYNFNRCDYNELVIFIKTYFIDSVFLVPQVSLSFMSQSCSGTSELYIYLLSLSSIICIYANWLFYSDESLYKGWYLIDINSISLFSSLIHLFCCCLLILQMMFAYKNYKSVVPLKIDAIEDKKSRCD